MYIADLSCSPINSLMKMKNMGITGIVPVDWMSFILADPVKILDEGSMDCGNNINGKGILDQLRAYPNEIHQLEEGRILCLDDAGHPISTMIVPVRTDETYKIFLIYAKRGTPYTQDELKTIGIFIKLLYENVLLNNEMVQERDYLANVLDSTDSMVFSANLNGGIITANTAGVRLFGAEKIIGKNIEELIGREDQNMCDVISQVAESNRGRTLKDIYINKGRGKKSVFNIFVHPLHNSKKHVVGVVVVATDVTTKKVKDSQLAQLKQFAALGEVAAGVAHDIGNPLMNIRGCAKVLQKEITDRTASDRYLEPIIHEVDRIKGVVDQLISYGQITARTNYDWININEVLENSINVLRFHKGSKLIDIKKQLAAELPLLKGNNVQLQQAFINILINAVQAIDKEGEVVISSYCDDSGKYIHISVADNGSGIAAKCIKKVLHPFYTTKEQGRGLGLSIVERVIKRHKGKIAISSQINQGTKIDVSLPY